MGKLKTKKGVSKRFTVTKKGTVTYASCGKSHLLSSKTRKRLRKLRKGSSIENQKHKKYLKRMLPYT